MGILRIAVACSAVWLMAQCDRSLPLTVDWHDEWRPQAGDATGPSVIKSDDDEINTSAPGVKLALLRNQQAVGNFKAFHRTADDVR